MKFLRTLKNSMFVVSLVYVAIGYLLYKNRDESLKFILILLAIGLLISALIGIIRYFLLKVSESTGRNDLIYGIIYLIIAGIVYFSKETIISYLYIVFGIMMIFSAILKIQDMVDAKKVKVRNISIYLIMIIIAVSLGILELLNPFDTNVFYIFTGLSLMFCGISDLISNIVLAIMKVNYEKKFEENEKSKQIDEEDDSQEETKFTRIDLDD